MTMPPPPANQKGMVRAIVIAIALMTTAIVVILAAMVAKLIAPSEDEALDAAPHQVGAQVGAVVGHVSGGSVDFTVAPEVEIALPPGARVIAAHVTAERLTLEIETAEGERSVYTAPLTGFDAPVRLVYRTSE